MENIKSRISHIDAIRGFMMLLVIYGHLMLYLTPTPISDIKYFFGHFRMPLFFFIAGFFLYTDNYSKELFKRRSINRLARQLYPTIIFWALFSLAFIPETWPDSWLTKYKGGYWFTYVSVEMFFIIAPLLLVLSLQNCSKRVTILAMIAVCTIVEVIFYVTSLTDYYILPDAVYGFLSWELVAVYLPYVILGIVAKMYIDKFNQICQSVKWAVALIAIFIATYIYRETLSEYQVIEKIVPYVLAFSGIIICNIIFSFLYRFTFVAESRIMRGLTFIGTSTLEIYLLHYFIVFGIKSISDLTTAGEMLDSICNTVFELPVYIVLSVIVAEICLFAVYQLKNTGIYRFLFPEAKH
ncbi:MAG: acyltransferase [Muribaculaceae bacterium]|nr:acyltransferase [Muribaculaceae bacterium]